MQAFPQAPDGALVVRTIVAVEAEWGNRF